MTDGARQITQVLGKARRALDRRAGPRVSAEVIPSARRSGILEVAKRYVTLKRIGRKRMGWPLPGLRRHDRFSVNTRKQVRNCLKCETHGNVIALVMHVSFAGVSGRCLIPRLAFTEETGAQGISCRRSFWACNRIVDNAREAIRAIEEFEDDLERARGNLEDAVADAIPERFVELSHDDEDDADNGRLFVIKGAIAEYPAEAIDAAFSNFDWFTRRALQRLREALARTREATP